MLSKEELKGFGKLFYLPCLLCCVLGTRCRFNAINAICCNYTTYNTLNLKRGWMSMAHLYTRINYLITSLKKYSDLLSRSQRNIAVLLSFVKVIAQYRVSAITIQAEYKAH